MHPLLVTHSRDLEKTSNRWKKMEFHDVLVESSRYSLISQESSKEEEMQSTLDLEEYGAIKSKLETPDIHDLCNAMSHDPLWTPGRRIEVCSPPSAAPSTSSTTVASPSSVQQQQPVELTSASSGASNLSKLILDSPPEAAIEATPESTPFVTPVKVRLLIFYRELFDLLITLTYAWEYLLDCLDLFMFLCIRARLSFCSKMWVIVGLTTKNSSPVHLVPSNRYLWVDCYRYLRLINCTTFLFQFFVVQCYYFPSSPAPSSFSFCRTTLLFDFPRLDPTLQVKPPDS